MFSRIANSVRTSFSVQRNVAKRAFSAATPTPTPTPTPSPSKGGFDMKKAFLISTALGVGLGCLLYIKNDVLADASKTCPLNPKAFSPFTVSSVVDVNHNTRVIRLALPAGESLNLPIASCVVVKAPIGENGKDVIRPYTPISSNTETGHWDLLVKTYPNGVMSKYLYNLKAGDSIDVKGPIPKISYTPNMNKKIGMICGGSGITPMLQVIHAILENPQDKTEINLIFANIATEDILLKNQLDSLAKKHSNLKVHYVLEKPGPNFDGSVGYVNADIIKKHIGAASNENKVFVCGTPGFMKLVSGSKAPDYSQGEVDGLLKELGYTKEQVFKF